MLRSFQGKKEVKEKILADTQKWLESKKRRKSAEEITNELFNPVRTYQRSGCVLENYDEFPDQLGLPNWLGDLLFTIHRFNSDDFFHPQGNYEDIFYPGFLEACNVGVDYSLLFHEWEIMILTEMLPQQERVKKYILDLIELHKDALSEKQTNPEGWTKLQMHLDDQWNEINKKIDKDYKEFELRPYSEDTHMLQKVKESHLNITKHSVRVAFLSIDNHIDSDPYTASSEALIDALLNEHIYLTQKFDADMEKKFRRKAWMDLMNRLLLMLKKWG